MNFWALFECYQIQLEPGEQLGLGFAAAIGARRFPNFLERYSPRRNERWTFGWSAGAGSRRQGWIRESHDDPAVPSMDG